MGGIVAAALGLVVIVLAFRGPDTWSHAFAILTGKV